MKQLVLNSTRKLHGQSGVVNDARALARLPDAKLAPTLTPLAHVQGSTSFQK